jgi:hypothetical protein
MLRRAVFFAISVTACGDVKTAPDAGGVRLQPTLDLTGVVGFAIAAAPAGEACPSTLHALHAAGELVATTMTDAASCAAAGPEQATAVFNTEKYVVVTYAAATGAALVGSPTCTFVVVRKSDGALQCGSTGSENPTRVVGNGDSLYLGITGSTTAGLSRLDMSTTPPTLSLVDDAAVTMNRFDSFDANNADDVLGSGNFGARVFKASGGTTNVNGSLEACQWYDASTDAFYVGTSRLKTPLRPARLVIERLDTSYAPVLAGELTSATNTPPECKPALSNGAQAIGWTTVAPGSPPALVELASAMGGVCWRSTGSPSGACTTDAGCDGTCMGGGSCLGGVCCVGGSHDGDACNGGDADCVGTCSKAGSVHTLTGLTSIVKALGHGATVFVVGTNGSNDVVLGVSTASFTQATLLQSGDYSLSATSLSTTGELSWAGQRISDAAHVVGTCNATSCVPTNASAPAITALQRID